jgi:hypothetical protein
LHDCSSPSPHPEGASSSCRQGGQFALSPDNVFTQDQLIEHAEGDDTRCQVKRGGIDLALLAAAAEGRLGTLSNHDLILLRHNQPKLTLQANRVELDGNVDANGRFRTLGTVRTEMRSAAAVGVLETGTDHNLLIRRNAVAHIELRGNDTTDFKQPITSPGPHRLGQRHAPQPRPEWLPAAAKRLDHPVGLRRQLGLGRWHHYLPHPVACRSVLATHLGPDKGLERPEPDHHQLRDPHLIQRQQRLLVARHRPVTLQWRRA